MRKESTVTVGLEGRDRGKVFRLREMPASQAEAWGSRLVLAMARAGVEVPAGLEGLGMAAVAAMGIRAIGNLPWDEAAPLLDEMFACIQIIPDPARSNVVRVLVEDDVEEVATRLWLRDQVILLHTGFSFAAYASKLKATREAASGAGEEGGPSIETSPAVSEP
jgi:hypothetical protein